MPNPKNILVLALCLALLVISAFYLVLTTAGDGNISVSEPDQVLYLQYAQNMASGHPYVFSTGDTPSSGSTTHLYILVLALLYRLGATGDAFLTASYLINALFYLGIIVMSWLIVRRMNPKAVLLALLMIVLSGHTASATLKQTDIGLFMLLTLSLFASLIHGRHALSIILTMLCAAARPEGFIFSIAFLVCGSTGWLLNRRRSNTIGTSKQSLYFLACGAAGIAVFALTLFVNYRFTGYFQFMSVANKGYFKAYPFPGAMEHTLHDALSLLKGVFFGLQESYRQFYLFPALSGILGFSGIMLYRRENSKIKLCECWAALSACAVLFLVASSQFQGVSNDRYLGWIIPLWIIYISIGWTEVSDRVKTPHFRTISASLLVLYQILSLTHMASTTYTSAIAMEYQKNLGLRINETFAPSIRFGSTVGGSINYFMPNHNAYNLYGITSPDFFVKGGRDLQRITDLLKHQPNLRFDYWISSEQFLENNPWIEPFVGELVMQDMNTALTSKAAFGVYEAKWGTLEGGSTPQLVVDNEIAHLSLIDQLDVGYIQAEQKHNYEYKIRLKNTSLELISKTDTLGSHDYSETGRIVLGSESFNIFNARQGEPLVIILRTGIQADGNIFFGRQYSKINKLELKNEIDLRLFVDKQEVPCPTVEISDAGFSEVVFNVPAQYIQTTSPKIELVGDHISYAYWFYQ